MQRNGSAFLRVMNTRTLLPIAAGTGFLRRLSGITICGGTMNGRADQPYTDFRSAKLTFSPLSGSPVDRAAGHTPGADAGGVRA